MSGPDEADKPGQDKAGSEQTHGGLAAQGPVPPTPATPASPPAPDASAEEEEASLPARLGEERLAEPVVRTGLFGIHGTPDTSGYGGLRVHRAPVLASPRPYGSYFDEIADALG
ncbi:MAG TPA: hypothetical protein VE888_16785, partial [Streptosporangiaceae bacterium]|nr:hypothetical protein [Streptosporangiaceae bacterium]